MSLSFLDPGTLHELWGSIGRPTIHAEPRPVSKLNDSGLEPTPIATDRESDKSR